MRRVTRRTFLEVGAATVAFGPLSTRADNPPAATGERSAPLNRLRNAIGSRFASP